MSRTSSRTLPPEDHGDPSCPSCGRYVGPLNACPHCGAAMMGRTPILTVRIAAIALTTFGLAVLWLVATRTEVPTIAIGRASATMNLAYVRVEGRCTRVPSYNPETDFLSFWVTDASGELHVTSYGSETRALIEQGKVPALGDWVSVAGTLRIREDFHSLSIDVPEQLTITRAEPQERAVGSIALKDEYERVRLRGQVRRLVEPYQGLTLITLRDETGAIDIAVSDELISLGGAAPKVEIGQSVEVTGSVSLYGVTPQLVPASTADVVALDTAATVATSHLIGELDEELVGQWVALRGTVTQIDPFSEGVKLALDDGTGTITVLLWRDICDGLRVGAELALGAEVQAQGQLSHYRGDLEVIPELAADVQVLAAAPKRVTTPISDLTGARVGQIISLAGTLGEPQGFSSGVKFPLSDETGTIILLLWEEVYEAISGARLLVSGAKVEVTGKVDLYRGELEIIPEADGVKVLEEE